MTTNLPSIGFPIPGAPQVPACPCCAGRVRLTWYRAIDRLTSRLAPIRRYRCQSRSCQWEGNVRFNLHTAALRQPAPADEGASDAGMAAGTLSPTARASTVVPAMLKVVGAALVAALATRR